MTIKEGKYMQQGKSCDMMKTYEDEMKIQETAKKNAQNLNNMLKKHLEDKRRQIDMLRHPKKYKGISSLACS